MATARAAAEVIVILFIGIVLGWQLHKSGDFGAPTQPPVSRKTEPHLSRSSQSQLQSHSQPWEFNGLTVSMDMQACASKQAEWWTDNRDKRFYSDLHLDRFFTATADKWHLNCSETSAMIDIGANTGQDVLHWLLAFGGDKCPTMSIHLFEPNPVVASTLNGTVKPFIGAKNSLHVHQMAAADKVGTMYFSMGQGGTANLNSNEWGTLAAKPKGKAKFVKVPVIRVSEFVKQQGISRVPLLKIDVEGFDSQVLYGAEEVFDRIETIVFESNANWDTGAKDRLGDIAELLHKHGFFTFLLGTPYSLKLWPGYWHDQLENKTWSNCVAVRRYSPLLKYIHPLC